jgi:hypothetical protein
MTPAATHRAMSTTHHPIQPAEPACFGVCCPSHGRCERYHAVEKRPCDEAVLETCIDGTGAFPLFLPIRPIEV